jgi:O-antigen/teichoic acid export membrane protein
MTQPTTDDTAAATEPAPRPLTGGAVMGAVSRLTVAVTGAATTILIARLLGAEGAGSFAIALTIVYVLTVLTTLGMEHGIAYYVSGGAWAPGRAFVTSQRLALGVGLLGAVAGVAARLAFPSAFGGLSVTECALAAGALPFALAWFYASYVALAADRYEAYVLPPAAQSTILLVLGAALVIPFEITGAIVALLVSNVIAAAGAFRWGLRRLRRPGEPEPPPGQLRRALGFGVKGYAANALQVLNYRVDVFVLSAVATTAAVGQYSVAVAVTGVLWLLPQALSDVLFPRVAALSASARRGAEEQRAFVEAKSLRHTTLIVVVSGAALALALVVVVVPVYGPEFRDSIALGLIRLPGVALIGIAGSLSAAVVGRGRPEYALYGALISTPVTMVLYATLIPSLEATGAALASSLSFAMNFVLAAFFYRRLTGLKLLPLIMPTRSELDDYRMLWAKCRAWLAGRRGAQA